MGANCFYMISTAFKLASFYCCAFRKCFAVILRCVEPCDSFIQGEVGCTDVSRTLQCVLVKRTKLFLTVLITGLPFYYRMGRCTVYMFECTVTK